MPVCAGLKPRRVQGSFCRSAVARLLPLASGLLPTPLFPRLPLCLRRAWVLLYPCTSCIPLEASPEFPLEAPDFFTSTLLCPRSASLLTIPPSLPSTALLHTSRPPPHPRTIAPHATYLYMHVSSLSIVGRHFPIRRGASLDPQRSRFCSRAKEGVRPKTSLEYTPARARAFGVEARFFGVPSRSAAGCRRS